MTAADALITQSPHRMRNTWSLAMRNFENSRSSCEVESSIDFGTTETGCFMSNANSKDLADLGVEVNKDSMYDVLKKVNESAAYEYTLCFKDSENAFFQTRLGDEDVDNSFLSMPTSLIHSIYFAASNDNWPTESNQGLRSILHAFMNNSDSDDIDQLLTVPSKTFTTSLPLKTTGQPQTFKATCNAYELRDKNHIDLQQYAHTQCKFQELHPDGLNVGHLVMETMSLQDKVTGYTATVHLIPSTVDNTVGETDNANENFQMKEATSEAHSVHVIHADAHFTVPMRCSYNKGNRKLQLPAYAALHELHASQVTQVNYKNLMRTSNFQNLHLGFGIASQVLRSSATPIVFLVVPCCKTNVPFNHVKLHASDTSAPDTSAPGTLAPGTLAPGTPALGTPALDTCGSDICGPHTSRSGFDTSDSGSQNSDSGSVQSGPVSDQFGSHDPNSTSAYESSTIVMREPQVRAEEAFYASYADIIQQDPIMRQALFRRSNREL